MEAEEVVLKQEVRGVFGRLGKQEEEGEGRRKEQEARVTSTSEEKTHEELRSARASASPGRGITLFSPSLVNICLVHNMLICSSYNRYLEKAGCGGSWFCHSEKQVCLKHYFSEGACERKADKEDQLWRDGDANNGSQRGHSVKTWLWQTIKSSSRT